jgi:hypothetical protein
MFEKIPLKYQPFGLFTCIDSFCKLQGILFKIIDSMKKFSSIFLFFLSTFFSVAQTASSKNVLELQSVKYQQVNKPISQFKALDFMKKPYELLNYWGDEPLSLQNYTSVEKNFQHKLNEKFSSDFVLAYSPVSLGEFPNDNYNLPIEQRNVDNEPITPYTWKWINFEIQHEDGAKDEVKVCRPNWWLKNIDATAIGKKVYLDIPETGIFGTALVTSIAPCQLDTRLLQYKREGEYVYRPVTGTFKHDGAEVWDFYFSQGEPLGATENHPFYSLDRDEYIEVGKLKIGERVKNFEEKEITLLRKEKRPKPESVYNLEIYRDHSYLVGTEKILVHNSYIEALTTESLEGVKLLSGFISKNGDELNVTIGLIYKQDGYGGSVFENLLNHLDNVAKENGTKSLKITFETITDVPTREFYKKQAAKYGFKISYLKSPISSSGVPALDIIWTK